MQVGAMFACGMTHHTRFAWNKLIRDSKDDQERSEIQEAMDASKKALYHHTGKRVSAFMAAAVASSRAVAKSHAVSTLIVDPPRCKWLLVDARHG